MLNKCRILLGVGLAFLIVAMATSQVAPPAVPAPAGKEAPKEDDKDKANEFSHAITLPTDSKRQKRMEAAKDLMKNEQWGDAVEQLQKLLNDPEDVFVQVTRKDTNGKESTHWTSVRAEANRLLGSLPPQGKPFYELRYGATARNRLDEAKKTGDPQILADVAARFLHTEAGTEATNLLGTYHLDRGRFVMAALCFDRLVSRDGPDKLSIPTLLKATIAFQRTGDKDNGAKTWRELSVRASREGLRLGDRTATLPELQNLLKQYEQPASETFSASDWNMFRGNPSRSAQGVGGLPFMETKWRDALVTEEDTRRLIDSAIKHQTDRTQPIVPAFFPIAAGGKLVYRSYWGIHAVDPKTGKLLWKSPSRGSLDRIAREAQQMVQLNQWLNHYQAGNPNLVYENSTLGTLSTDNSRVYLVEDLALPPHPMFLATFNNGWGNAGTPNFGPLNDQVYHNKLQAFDLDTGKILWEIGGYGEKKGSVPDLAESYFLGPPLPMGGKLYLLVEKNQELKLVCLDASKDPNKENPISWSQTLAATREKMLQDINRRIRVAPLAYGDGIIVCPTNAGAILGVDLLTHSLVWAYAYRDKNQAQSPEEEQLGRFRARPWMAQGQSIALPGDQWKPSAPIIQDGKIVFTAQDGTKVFCLNLRDGSLRWNVDRKDDVYLGGVYNGKVLIVGKNNCRALALDDGKQVWALDTGMPSGQGMASENVYYLPLRYGVHSKEPEICAIDIDKGKELSHTKSRKMETPGNLLFYEGDVISQSPTEVAAYPQLKVKLDEIDKRIAKNPNDPVGLTERGELRLDQGRIDDALTDLHLALANNPPKETLPKTRAKLYETLTTALQENFNKYEKHLDEYKGLCQITIDPKASEDDKAKSAEEQWQREGNRLTLLAKGREKQGRLVEAFEAYLEFGTRAKREKQELVSVIDERDVKTPPDVWTQGRIAAMVATAAAEQRQPLDALIQQKWQMVQKAGGNKALEDFVDMFGSQFAVGREARLLLAERLIQENGPDALLQAERHLLRLRGGDDPTLAAKAVEALARLMTRKNLLEDAAYFYFKLGKDYPKVVVRDGKTGSDIFEEILTDKRFLPYLPAALPTQARSIQVSQENGHFQAKPVFTFDGEGELLPFFQRHRLAMALEPHEFVMQERGKSSDEAPVWRQRLTRTNFHTFAQYMNYPASKVRFPYQVMGHLVVLNLGQIVYALDPINKKVLWEKPLYGNGALPSQQAQPVLDPKEGALVIAYADGWAQRIGEAGPVQPAYVCLLTHDGLTALEPVTGRTLWIRKNVSGRTQMHGDGEYLFLVELNHEGNATGTKVLRAHDGVSVPAPDFTQLYKQKVQFNGRTLLVAEGATMTAGPVEPGVAPQAPPAPKPAAPAKTATAVTLRLYDVPTGKEVWSQTFAANSTVLHSEDNALTGVVEPDGKLSVFDLNARKQVLKAKLDHPALIKKEATITLLQDDSDYYVAVNNPVDKVASPWGAQQSNLLPTSGMRCIPVNGELYAFDKTKGERRWFSDEPNQMIVMEQFRETPMILMTARNSKPVGVGGARNALQYISLQSRNKLTGKLLFDEPEKSAQTGAYQFHTLNADHKNGRYEFISFNFKLTHVVAGSPAALTDAGTITKSSSVGARNLEYNTVIRGDVRVRVAPAAAPAAPVIPAAPPAKEKAPPKDKK